VNFAHPAWLVLLVLPPLLGVAALVVARLRGNQWAAFIAPRLRPALLKRGTPLPHWFSLLFLLAACAVITAALARPQGDAGTRTEKSLGRNLLIALDLSRSMRVADVKPDRLTRAKMTIYELLEAAPNERVGLIGFAGSAYLYAPLTVDHRAVRETIEQIDETWTTRGGSSLAGALRLGIDTLKATGQKNNALVILSDGEKHDNSLDDLIEEARQSGVYIVAIGVGTEDGDYVPNPDFPQGRMVDRQGQPVISRLQPDVLRHLAAETRGRYAVAAPGTDIAAMVNDVVKDLDAFEIEGRERSVAVEFYQWLLLPGILFLLASAISGTRWRGVRTAMLAAGLFLTTEHPAAADAVADAAGALRNQDYTTARTAYRELAEKTPLSERRARFRLGEATAAWHLGDFRGARHAYSGALLSSEPEVLQNAHLGMGKTLFQLGWLVLDQNPYPNDPQAVPNIEQFDALVRAKLAEIRSSEEESSGVKQLEGLIMNWTDAVRHFESASPDPAATHNRQVAMAYLKRLRELLDEDRQQTEESMPQPQPGEGQPQQGEPNDQQGEGEPREDQEQGDSGDEPREDGKQGDSDQQDEPRDGNGEQQEKPDDKSGKQEKEENKPDDARDPNESPEDRARRILRENADLEKGPLTPGRHEFNPPEKDW
jgi:Ca-activated chloride channel family protein